MEGGGPLTEVRREEDVDAAAVEVETPERETRRVGLSLVVWVLSYERLRDEEGDGG